MSAVLFGSMSTLADTSELQREAFNRAFVEHGLDWSWDQEEYRAMLAASGGQDRIAQVAARRGQDVDAAAVHATKSRLFQQSLAGATLTPRPGVMEALGKARADGWKVGLVTTTSPENVAALLGALSLAADDFDVVTDVTTVQMPKPDPAVYVHALNALGETAGACVAVEDNVGGAQAAVAAGLACLAFPNTNTAGLDFPAAARRIDRLDVADLHSVVARP